LDLLLIYEFNIMTMKQLFFVLLFFIATPLSLRADAIDAEGIWGGRGTRTLLPSEPIAYSNSNVLSIYFTDAITNLYVCVTDSDGYIIYADYISAPSGNLRMAPLFYYLCPMKHIS
jgi:hypothetical protein